jgi:hypothetical protein
MEMTKTGKALNESDLAEFESKIGYSLPVEYREFLMLYNGGKPVPDFFRVPDWEYEETYVTELKGLANGKSVDLSELFDLLHDRLPKGFIAIGSDPGGNQILLSLSKDTKGQVYFFDHENEPEDAADDVKGYPNIYLVAKSFNEFLKNLYSNDES